ncbi:MAG: NAD(P)H-dependent oxidoreductase subunit E, partial [Actinomycetota bacterium]
MDLHLMSAAPTDDERASVDELLGPPDTGWVGGERASGDERRFARGGRAARERRDLLLPALHALQSGVGWISEGGLTYVCQRLSVPPAEAYGVATFYAMFSVRPRPGTVVHVCDDLACRIGGDALCGELERTVGPPGEPVEGAAATWLRSPCLGMCERAPAALVQRSGRGSSDESFGMVSVAQVRRLLDGDTPEPEFARPTDPRVPSAPQTWDDDARGGIRLLRRVGVVDPSSIDDYRAHGGYETLRRAHELGSEGVIREVTDSQLLGRGGAAFPTGVKWKAVAEQAAQPHFFICNADESEPGTFKDRVMMEQDPFAVIEALTIAGHATGCERGYIYIRGEYPLATERLEHAIAEARGHGFLGGDVMGEGFAFDIELRRGAGAYICGEETALFNSIEGKRGEPRNKP